MFGSGQDTGGSEKQEMPDFRDWTIKLTHILILNLVRGSN